MAASIDVDASGSTEASTPGCAVVGESPQADDSTSAAAANRTNLAGPCRSVALGRSVVARTAATSYWQIPPVQLVAPGHTSTPDVNSACVHAAPAATVPFTFSVMPLLLLEL